jgi:hypothetical protein
MTSTAMMMQFSAPPAEQDQHPSYNYNSRTRKTVTRTHILAATCLKLEGFLLATHTPTPTPALQLQSHRDL